MYKIIKGFDCRTTKGTNMVITSGTILESYVLNPSRNSITLNFPDMTCEVEDDFDIKEYIVPMDEEEDKCKYTQYESDLRDTKAVLNYLNALKYQDNPPSLNEWLKSETERLQKEYNNLSIINADDKDIILQALIEMSNTYNANGQFNVANKITKVREKFLSNGTEKFVKTNLNYHIKVKLNDYGKQIHYDDWKDICEETGTPYKLEVDEEGYSMFQIHDFMNTFGKHAHIGAKPFLETNDVLIERSK